jgi:hypothetical protein
MRFSEAEFERWAAEERSRRMEIFYVQQAAKRPRRIFDDHHPEAIRERIAALQALLQEAGA